MLHKLRFVIAGILMILVNQAVTFAVSASRTEALLPAGTTRYAAAYSSIGGTFSWTGGWGDVPGMTKYITIPEGQVADVLVEFCVGLGPISAPHLQVRATVRGQPAVPPTLQLAPSTTVTNACADFYMTSVSAGQPPIKIQIDVAPGSVYLANAVMLVTVNLR